jgi:hypothetical protein
MRFRSRALAAALLALAIAPAAARAQSRFTVGGAVVYADPLGEFGNNVRRGFGLDGFGTIALEPTGIASLRAELGYVQYARKAEPFLASTGFGVVELESETTSGVFTAGIGPQFSIRQGSMRPYLGGTVGFARFATNTKINLPARSSETGQDETLDEVTVSSDWVLSLAAVAGIGFEVPALGRGVLIDVGARWHRNGQARYVTPDGVQYDGSGRPTITPSESEADFIVYRLGIIVPIGK